MKYTLQDTYTEHAISIDVNLRGNYSLTLNTISNKEDI